MPTAATKKTNQTTKKTTHQSDTTKTPSPIAANTTLVVTLPWSAVEPAYDTQLKKGAKKLKVKGFRQGKVPASYAKKMLDQETLINETINQLLPEAYHQAIHQGDHRPITHPDFKPLKVEWGSDWEIEAAFAEAPTVTIKNWQKTARDGLKKAGKEWEKQQRELEKNSQEKASKTKGQTNQKADQEADPKASASKQQAQKEEFLLQHLFATLAKEYGPAIPELLIREQTRSQLENLSRQLEQMGANMDQYLERRGQKFEDLAQEMAVQSLTRLQMEFVLQAIEADLKIEIAGKDIEAEFEKILTAQKIAKDKRPALSEEIRQNLRANLSRQALVKKLLASS